MIHRLTYEYEEPDYEEEFKIITYPGIKSNKYVISTYGNLFCIKKDGLKLMKTYYDKDDHEKITLVTDVKHKSKRGNKSKHYFVHRLMVWEFIGPPPDLDTNIVNHKNGIPCCNLIHNLEWCTVLYNTNHAKSLGLFNNSGIQSSNNKYSEKLIRKICSLFNEGYLNYEIFEIITGHKKESNKDNGLYSLINKLGKKMCYFDIVSEYDYEPLLIKSRSEFDIEKITKMILEGKNNKEILKEFGTDSIAKNKKLYNRIIYERSKCKIRFND